MCFSAHPLPPPTQKFHLGSNAVLSPNNDSYLAICHTSSKGIKRYQNHVYEFGLERPWPLLRFAPTPLELPLGSVKRGFVFVGSLARVDGLYLVGYTANDLNAMFMVFSGADLMRGLQPLESE